MAAVDSEAVLERREFFPRGLVQPASGYRFSLDSLLLACFAHAGRRQTGADLGCGCGVVGIGMALRQPDLRIVGIDVNADSIRAAAENSVNLHLIDKLTFECADVADWRPEKVLDFVVANPPYRDLSTGRASRGEDRRTARFEERSTFAGFARCAAVALKTRGRFAFVHLPERLPELLSGLADNGLAPKRMRLVHGRAQEGARMVLVEAVKAGAPGLVVEPPLILHKGRGRQTRLTRQALDFCPFLACNTGEAE
ncbi:MAG: methyltransferase [Desulfovibrionaceae bacterium]|nr:methyltransferase [Desulfovibrionaceae bacterium]